MHIGGVLVFEPAAGRRHPPIEALRERLAARLGELPRYRQRLSEPHTGGLHWPSWVMDEFFDIERHVRQAELPAPAGEAELLAWAGEYFSIRLDARRPLWEIVSARARRRPLGPGHQDPPLHGRRRRLDRHRPDDPRRRARARPSRPARGSASSDPPGAAPTPATPPEGSPPRRAAALGRGELPRGDRSRRARARRGGRGAVACTRSELREAATRAEAVTELLVGSELIAAPRDQPERADRRRAAGSR